MGLVLCRAEGVDLHLGLPCRETLSVSIHPPVHSMFPFSDCVEWNGLEGNWHVMLESFERHVAMLPKVLFDHAPKELNKIEFTVELGEDNT